MKHPSRPACRSSGNISRLAVGAFLISALSALPVRAQTEAVPDEPAWDLTAPAPTPSPDIITLEDDLAAPSPPSSIEPTPEPSPIPNSLPPSSEPVIAPAPEELDPARFADPIPSPIDPAEATLEQEILDDPNIPTPPAVADDQLYLPDLNNPMEPFFQRDGLKFRLGELHLRIPFGLSFQYDDNIFQRNTDRVADFITAFSPTLLLGIGDFRAGTENFFSLSYTPQFQFFLENSNLNTTNEFLNFTGQYAFPRLTTSAAFSYSRDSNPTSTEVGRRERINYNFVWENSYAIASKTFLEAVTSASYQDDGAGIDYTTVSLSPRIAYQYSPKLRFNLGPTFGVTFVQDDGNQTFQGLNLGSLLPA